MTGPAKSYELSVDDQGDPVLTDPAAGRQDTPASSEVPAPENDSETAASSQPDPAPQPQPSPSQEPAPPPEPDHDAEPAHESGGVAEPALQRQPRERKTSGEPQLATTQSEMPDDPPDDTGAMLAEAGPL